MSFAQWKQQRNTSRPADQHSVVADPLFRDPNAGDYSLDPKSPALALGFQPLPPITAPTLAHNDPPVSSHSIGQYNEVWLEPSVEPGITEPMNLPPHNVLTQLLTVNGSMPIGNGDLTASVFPELEKGAITIWLAKQDALAESSLPFKLGELTLGDATVERSRCLSLRFHTRLCA